MKSSTYGNPEAPQTFIRVQQKKRDFIITSLSAAELTQISYVSVRGRDAEEGAVQRLLNPLRIGTYIEDVSDTYTFDADHAMIAYPLKVIRDLTDALRNLSPVLSESEGMHIRAKCSDSSGPLSKFLSILSL